MSALWLGLLASGRFLWFVRSAGDFAVVDLEGLAIGNFISVLLILEYDKPKAPRFFAFSMLDNIGNFSRAYLGFKEFLQFSTIDVGREAADEEFPLLEFLGVLAEFVLPQLGLAFDRAVLEHMALEFENRVVGLPIEALDYREPFELLLLSTRTRHLFFRELDLAELREIIYQILLSRLCRQPTHKNLKAIRCLIAAVVFIRFARIVGLIPEVVSKIRAANFNMFGLANPDLSVFSRGEQQNLDRVATGRLAHLFNDHICYCERDVF